MTDCICKKEKAIMGNTTCSKPFETCLLFGDFGLFYIDNNNARQIEKSEACKILDVAEEHGLVLNPTNTQRLSAICCCCTCCCPLLEMLKSLPKPGETATTYFRARIDRDLCTGCSECLTICPMEAIVEDAGISHVSPERCIGCGLCVSKCPIDAISLEQIRDKVEAPPKTFEEMRAQIAHERGL